MIHRPNALAAWAGLVALCVLVGSPVLAADASTAAAYALRLPLTTAADAPLQRLELPARALIALQSPGYADVRVFNAAGQPVPMALSPLPHAEAGRQQTVLQAYPLLGTTVASGALDSLALRIEERRSNGVSERVVTVNTPAVAAGATLPPAAPQTLGALLDARAVQRPAVAVMLEADLPIGQPVTFTLASSADLATWRPLAETVLFRDGNTSLGTSTLEFAASRLAGRYLRVSWADASGQLAAVTLRRATLVTQQDAAAVVRPSATIAAPLLTSARTVSFSLPFATPVAALQVRPEGSNVVIPLRVFGRLQPEQPWQPLASTVVFSLQSAAKLQISGPVALPGTPVRDIKFEADEKTPGFSAPPEVAVLFDPVYLVFVASGPAPFTLAVGLPQAANAWLPLNSLMPAANPGQTDLALQAAALPLAVVAGAGVGLVVITAPPVSDAPAPRSLVLWGVLLAGALALAVMAWVLLRQTPSGSADKAVGG